jgi:Lar family restriction alleviation protein
MTTDNKTTELLPCPFCGGEAEIVALHPYEETPVGICCSRCPAIFADGTTYSGFKEYDTEAEAIAAWNTRAERTCENVGERCDFACSECGARLYTKMSDGYTMILGDEETILLKPNYCPNCGAKMDGDLR